MSRLAAWGVHLYTASGVMLALLALEAIGRADYRAAFVWMALATLIDCTDGTLARRFRVKQVLPHFDGAKLDDIVDYINYVLVPIMLAMHAGLFPTSGQLVLASLPLLASAYGFCQSEAKTADHFFTGFPSYWNIVVLYLCALRTPLWFNVAAIVFFSFMVFVPIRYLYPSRGTAARRRIYVLGSIWAVLVFLVIGQFPAPSRALAVVSLFFPAYYMGKSLHVHFTTPRTPPASR